jgi:hypothetical protein
MLAHSGSFLNNRFGVARRQVRQDVLFAAPAAVFTALLAAATGEYAWRGSPSPHARNLVMEDLARA